MQKILSLEELKRICGLYAVYQIRSLGVAENNSSELTEKARIEVVESVEKFFGPMTSDQKNQFLG